MPVYNYRVIDSEGSHREGSYSAENVNEAASYLRNRKNTIIKLKRKGSLANLAAGFKSFGKRKITSRDYMVFCRHFAAMVNSGLNILKSLDILCNQEVNIVFGDSIREISLMLRKGNTLAESMAGFPDVFPPVMTNMIAVGEKGGILGEVLDGLAYHYERQSDLEEKIRSAMIYPSIITVVALIVLGIMFFFILPTFGDMFLNLGVEMPALTMAVLRLGDFVSHYRLLLFILMVILIGFLKIYFKTDRGKEKLDLIKLRLPVFSRIYKKNMVSRFARNLGSLLKSGVDILTSLKLVEKLIDNHFFIKDIKYLRRQISDGETMASSLKRSKLFPGMMVEMISVGEETGYLDEMLNRTADFYENEIKYSVERISAIIEPAILVFVGFFVGILVLSIILPMFLIYESI